MWVIALTTLLPTWWLSHLVSVGQAAPESDYISDLPLFGKTPTPHYSGYLDATDGCNKTANGDFCNIHYWYAEAEGPDASSKPVVLWMNGGPGSSSLFGFFAELGPLLMNSTGGLMKNPYSWTKVAHLIALESPVGVGFSYCQAMMNPDPLTKLPRMCINNDRFTASGSRAALVDFFTTKFPELAQNDFYITGESYAGVYGPTLAKELLDHASDTVNLVGLALGDPCTDNTAQRNSFDSLWFGHKYNLVMDQTFDFLWNTCRARAPGLSSRDFIQRVKKRLTTVELSTDGVVGDWTERHDEVRRLVYNEMSNSISAGAEFRRDLPRCRLEFRKFLISASDQISQRWPMRWINDFSLFGPSGLHLEDDHLHNYILRPDVRAAIHVEEAPVDDWDNPAQGLMYTKEFDACNKNVTKKGAPSMIHFYRDIIPRLKVTWVYNGDADPAVSVEGTRTAVTRFGFNELDGGSYRPWFYNHTATSVDVLREKAPKFGPDLLAVPTGIQFGGEVVDYEHNLAFVTVHGSGHMVPEFRPQAALHMLKKFLLQGSGEFKDSPVTLSPLLPKNATLEELSDAEFAKTLDMWTEKARSPPWVSRE